MPVTYPVWPVNGIFISGMLTQSKTGMSYPENIMDELPDYKVESDANFSDDKVEEFLDNVYDVLAKREKAIFQWLKKGITEP